MQSTICRYWICKQMHRYMNLFSKCATMQVVRHRRWSHENIQRSVIQPKSDSRVKITSPLPYSLLPDHGWKVTTVDSMLLAYEQVKSKMIHTNTQRLHMGHVDYAVVSSSSKLSAWSSLSAYMQVVTIELNMIKPHHSVWMFLQG